MIEDNIKESNQNKVNEKRGEICNAANEMSNAFHDFDYEVY